MISTIAKQLCHHIEITYDYILFWFLSLDLAGSFDIMLSAFVKTA